MSPRWSISTKRTVAIGMLLVCVYILYLARGIVTPFVLGALLVLILKPFIDFLHRRFRFPYALAVATSYIILLGVIVAIPVLFLPALARSAAALDVGAIVAELSQWAATTLASLRSLDLFGSSLDLSSSIDPLIEALETGGEGFEFDPGEIFGGALSVTSAIFVGVIGFLTTALLTLVISIYLALTLKKSARDSAYSMVPPAFMPELRTLGERIASVWSDYLRGQLTVAVVIGVLTALLMFALGVPGAMVLGVIGGFFNIIPTFGPLFASVVAGLVALVQGSNYLDVSNPVFALIVVGAYAVIQQLESNVIAPRILGGAVSVTPLAILLGILIGFGAAGLLGAIIAVPVVASTRVIFLYIRAKLLDEDPFPEVEPAPRATVGEGGIIVPAEEAEDVGTAELDGDGTREDRPAISSDL